MQVDRARFWNSWYEGCTVGEVRDEMREEAESNQGRDRRKETNAGAVVHATASCDSP